MNDVETAILNDLKSRYEMSPSQSPFASQSDDDIFTVWLLPTRDIGIGLIFSGDHLKISNEVTIPYSDPGFYWKLHDYLVNIDVSWHGMPFTPSLRPPCEKQS